MTIVFGMFKNIGDFLKTQYANFLMHMCIFPSNSESKLNFPPRHSVSMQIQMPLGCISLALGSSRMVCIDVNEVNYSAVVRMPTHLLSSGTLFYRLQTLSYIFNISIYKARLAPLIVLSLQELCRKSGGSVPRALAMSPGSASYRPRERLSGVSLQIH